MCGRATLVTPGEEIAEALGLSEVPSIEPRFNIAPTQPIPVVRGAGGKRVLEQLRWGLVPPDARDVSVGARMINARVETVEERPSFSAAFAARRCLVVVDGFYEWQRQGKNKRPHHVKRKDGGVLALAGLWERWVSKDGEVVESCSILTTAAKPPVTLLHDRMPIVLDASDHTAWLTPGTTREELRRILSREPPELELVPVSRFVNNANHEGPECLRREGGTNLELF